MVRDIQGWRTAIGELLDSYSAVCFSKTFTDFIASIVSFDAKENFLLNQYLLQKNMEQIAVLKEQLVNAINANAHQKKGAVQNQFEKRLMEKMIAAGYLTAADLTDEAILEIFYDQRAKDFSLVEPLLASLTAPEQQERVQRLYDLLLKSYNEIMLSDENSLFLYHFFTKLLPDPAKIDLANQELSKKGYLPEKHLSLLIAKSQLLKTANPVASQALAAAALDAVCPDFANNGISLVHNQDWHGGMMQILAESDTVAHLLKTKFAGLPEPLVHYWHWLNTYAMQRKDQDLIQKLSQANQKYWQEVDNLSLRTYLVENQAYSETFLSALNTTFDPQKKQVFFNNFLNIKASLLWLSQAYLKQKKPLTARQTQELLKLYQNLLLTNPPQNVLLAAAEIWQLVPNDQIRTAILSLKGQTPVQQTSLAHLGLIKKQGLVQRQNQTERLIKESRKNGL